MPEPAPHSDRVDQIFLNAISISEGPERERYLSDACAEDDALMDQVRSLLRAHVDAGSFLETSGPARRNAPDSLPPSLGPDAPYNIREKLGEGSFGSVWLADQTEPIRRSVAIKFIKLGMDTEQVVARFRAERQALALMNHPGIARVFEAGATESGRPYFVMEYIRGAPIVEFCDERRLSTRARLALFLQVCAAIEHAHQKGVIHRDLKPGNVLVTQTDGEPFPKLIDFGIAKATGPGLIHNTLLTKRQQIIGTPVYMSPEQAEMSTKDIDTRSDIYSMGVLLYELLTGATPFDASELARAGVSELPRVIGRATPVKPSTRVSDLGETAITAAESRSTDASRLRSQIRGDLDWIIMKCLEKEPPRRYQSASELAADISRHLEDQPVSAGPPSASYAMKKFAKRYKIQVAAGVAVAASLLVGSAGSTAGLVWALKEKGRADQQTEAVIAAESETQRRVDELREVVRFQAGRLESVDVRAMGEQIKDSLLESVPESDRETLRAGLAPVNFTSLSLSTLRTNIFEPSIAAIDAQFEDQPLVRARLLFVLGRTLDILGLTPSAQEPLRRSLDLYNEFLGENEAATLDTMNSLVVTMSKMGKFSDAEPLAIKVYEGRRLAFGEDDRLTLVAMNNVLGILASSGRYEEALPYAVRLVDSRRRALGDQDPDTIVAIINAAKLMRMIGRIEESEAYFEEAVASSESSLGTEHPVYLDAVSSLGTLYIATLRFDQAEPLARTSLKSRRALLGEGHPLTLRSQEILYRSLIGQRRTEEAEPVALERLRISMRELGPRHPTTLSSQVRVAELRIAQERLEEAEASLAETVAASLEVFGPMNPQTLATKDKHADVLLLLDRAADALPIYRDIYESRKRAHGLRDHGTLTTMGGLSQALAKLGELEEAAELSEGMLSAARARFDPSDPRLGSYLRMRGEMLLDIGNPAGASEPMLEAYETLTDSLGSDHPQTRDLAAQLAGLYNAWHAAEPNAGHDAKARSWQVKAASAENSISD